MGTDALAPALARLEKALDLIGSPHFEGEKVFTAVFAETASSEARASDARRRAGTLLGPLDGRLVSVKALFNVAGHVTTAGSKVLRRLAPAKADATAVARLRAAGAIVVGATQMTEFAFSALGTNPHDGTPGNPRDRRRVPGGSSSGAVVSVVDGMVDIAIGSDTGGSLRIPAALSGAVGFKPTSGRVPTDGAFSLSSTLDTIGPIAMDVASCAAADAVLAGVLSGEFRAAPVDSFRLRVASGRLFNDCEPSVLAAFNDAMERLRAADIFVGEAAIDDALGDVADIDRIGTFPPVELRATLRELGVDDITDVDPNTRARIELGERLGAVDYVRMVRLRNDAVRRFETALALEDVVVMPTTPIGAPLIASIAESSAFHRANGLVLRNARVANLLDCPAISLPLPGLVPTGLMLVGRRHSDRRLLDIAGAVQKLVGAEHQGR
jgi:aspartyl-tRNA(Asn)/glutamyl-tRNA(Gln) amidotransferase subunit A